MKTQEVKQKLKEAGLSYKQFLRWMSGQTVRIGKDGQADYYECDVDRFIKGRGKLNTLD